MITVLESIRWELATLRLRVSCLEEAEVVLGPLYEPMDPEPMEPCQPVGPKSGATKRVPRKSTRRRLTRAQVREHIIAHGPITRGELLAALGCHPHSIDSNLSRLLAAGEIGADGRPGERRYRPPDTPEVVSLPSVELSGISAPRTLPDRGVYPMYDAIVDLDGATTEQLTRRTGLPANLVVEQGRRLIRLGLVGYTGVGDARVWLPAQTEIARDAA
jgi:hypothetical protein